MECANPVIQVKQRSNHGMYPPAAQLTSVCIVVAAQILRDPETSPREQLHGVSALVNLFAHNSTNSWQSSGGSAGLRQSVACREVVRVSGGIDAFVKLLETSIAAPDASKSELTAQAALALGFLARSDANREAIRAAGGIPLL
eukprot:scaffold10438_cov40-Prasinocladus_malaysianus.AAC.2